jgi:hypothetical protein
VPVSWKSFSGPTAFDPVVGSDDIDVSGPGEAEILATWARVIADLKAGRVCFYLGRGRG